MGLFGGKKKQVQKNGAYRAAEQVLDQAEAFCNSVLQYVDGTSEGEQKMIAEVRDKLGNAARLRESLADGTLDPQMCQTMGFALTFGQLVEIVTKLDASTSEERALIDAAKKQLAVAVKAGYGPALELQQKGALPL